MIIDKKIFNFKLSELFFYLSIVLLLLCAVPVKAQQSSRTLRCYQYSQGLIKQQKYSDADMFLTQGIMKDPRSEKLLLLRATNRANNLGKIYEAINDYSLILRLNPKNYKIFFRRGVWLYKLGQYALALKDFNRTISLKPKYSKAYLERAKVYALLGDYKRAKMDLNTLVKINPSYKRAADTLYSRIIQGRRDL